METELGNDTKVRENEEEGSRLFLQDWISERQLLELIWFEDKLVEKVEFGANVTILKIELTAFSREI